MSEVNSPPRTVSVLGGLFMLQKMVRGGGGGGAVYIVKDASKEKALLLRFSGKPVNEAKLRD